VERATTPPFAWLNKQLERRRSCARLSPALTSPYAWQRLECFAAAVRYPTLHEAARARGVTPAALIKQIQRLEKDLGQQLLERAERGHPMKLTPFGHKVASHPGNPRGEHGMTRGDLLKPEALIMDQ
jgi:hypothetical protein